MAIVHAKMNARATETLLAHAFSNFVRGRTVVFCGADLTRAKFLLSRWFHVTETKTRRFTGEGVDCKLLAFSQKNGQGEFWFVEGRRIRRQDLPIPSVERLYAIDAQRIQSDLSREFRADMTAFAGLFSLSSHWFYDYIHSAEARLDIDADAIIDEWPDEEEYRLPKNDPFYQRWMELKDVEPEFSASSFISFARRRLKITTDKPREFLTPKQQREAQGQWGTPIVSFDMHRFQKRYSAAKRLGRMKSPTGRDWHLVLKFRRGGVTVQEQGQSYQLCTENPYSSVATFAHTSASTKRIFRIARLMQEKDPLGLPLVNESKSELEFANGSLFFIGTAGGKAAFRGDTLRRVHWSEVSKSCVGPNQIANQKELLAGIVGAASNGQIVAESTPNGKEWMFEETQKWKAGQSEWNLIFFRWFDDPRNRLKEGEYNPEEVFETLTNEERGLSARHGLTMAQIAFRRQKKREYGELFPQEMPEDLDSCFLSSGTPYFDIEVIKDRIDSLITVPKKSIPGGYEIRWEEPKPGRTYVAGCDTSEGLPGCDLNGVGVLDKETGAQVAAIHGLFDPGMLGENAVRLCTDYNRAMLGVERENHGHAVLQRVIQLGYRKPHFRGGPLYYFSANKANIDKSRAGWSTNGETRPVMLSDLREAVNEGQMKVRDLDFLGECLSFRLQSTGKWEHDVGAHDDTIVKWAIAWQMRKHHRKKPRITIVGASV